MTPFHINTALAQNSVVEIKNNYSQERKISSRKVSEKRITQLHTARDRSNSKSMVSDLSKDRLSQRELKSIQQSMEREKNFKFKPTINQKQNEKLLNKSNNLSQININNENEKVNEN